MATLSLVYAFAPDFGLPALDIAMSCVFLAALCLRLFGRRGEPQRRPPRLATAGARRRSPAARLCSSSKRMIWRRAGR
jgi:hypothetical protein